MVTISYGYDKENLTNISMHILLTVLYTFPMVMTRRIWLTVKYAYSPYCTLYISFGYDKENLTNSLEFFQLAIISFVLVT